MKIDIRAAQALLFLLLLCGTCFGNPVPLINQPVVPDAAIPGSAGFTLTVNGTGFVSGAVVNWNGSPRPTTFVSSSQVTAVISASDVANPTTASVTVTNLGPGGGTSNVAYFEVTLATTSLSLSTPWGVSGGVSFIGDFNGDGILDAVSTEYNYFQVCISLGKGDGTFASAKCYSTGDRSYPVYAVAADFNADGKLDIATANSYLGFSVFLGNGDGTLQSPTAYPGEAFALAAGDLNGDGKIDLAVAAGYEVCIFLGNGDGSFQSFQPCSVIDFSASAYSITMGDFNRDGKIDLAVVGPGIESPEPSTVSVLLGNGDGSFKPPVTYATGSLPSFVTAADFNDDGILDLAVSNFASSSDSVSILLGNGDGTFQTHIDYPVGFGPIAISTGDFNGDGKLDLIVANQQSGATNQVSVLLGNGDGTFQTQIEYSFGYYLTNVIAADLNQDGRLDFIVGSYYNNSSVVLQSPAVTVSPTSLSFGNQNVGTTSSSQTATVTNTGSVSFSISDVSITGTNPGDFSETNNCPSALSPSATCTITVTFAPTAPGSRTASVTITDNAPGSPQTITLTGTGIAPAVSLSNTSLTFAAQLVGTTSSPQAVTLTNTGTATLTISSITATGAFSQTNNCIPSVAAGSSCSISVVFSPTSTGTVNGTISITDNASGSPQIISLTGTGVAPAVQLSTTSLTFAAQLVGTSSNPQPVVLTNTGTASLTISNITISGAFSQTNNCGSSVGAGAYCTINVVFSPTATGSFSGTVTINDNATGSPQTVALNGTGVAPAVKLSTTSLNFPAQLVGTSSSPQAVTLNNTGTGALTISSISITGAFSQTNTCGSTVAAKTKCTINIVFSPTTSGTLTGAVSITDNASGSPQMISLTGIGIAPAVTLSTTTLAFPTQLVGTSSNSQPVTLTNTGTAALTISSISTTGAFTQTNTCGSSVAISASCTISVVFAPTVLGAASGTLSITDNASGSPQAVSLSGTGTIVELSTYGLAARGKSQEKVLVCRNILP